MRFITGLLFLIGSLFIYEQSLATPQELIETKKTEMRLTEALERLKRVEDQFAIIRDYNDDFLAVIYWSLGIIGAMTVVLIGFNWFQNSKLQKREFDSLKNKMIEMIRSQLNELSSTIDAKLAKLDNEINKRVENIAKSEIRDIKQVLLIHKYIELENEIKSKNFLPYSNSLNKLAECAAKIGRCDYYLNDIVTEEQSGNYYHKLLSVIDSILINLQNNKQYDSLLELSAAIENSINMVPDESYDNSHLSMKRTLMTRLKNITDNSQLQK